MKLVRQVLLNHLDKIMAGGQIDDVLFGPNFEVTVLSEDQSLLVIAPKLGKGKGVGKQFGFAPLDFLKGCVQDNDVGGAEGTHMQVSLESSGRLNLEGEYLLLTADPGVYRNEVTPEIVESLQAAGEGVESFPISSTEVGKLRKKWSRLKPSQMKVEVGKKNTTLHLGTDSAHQAPVTLAAKADEEYTLFFGEQLVKVLSCLTDWTLAKITFTGPNSVVIIEEGAYQWILSPLDSQE